MWYTSYHIPHTEETVAQDLAKLAWHGPTQSRAVAIPVFVGQLFSAICSCRWGAWARAGGKAFVNDSVSERFKLLELLSQSSLTAKPNTALAPQGPSPLISPLFFLF